MKKMCPKCNKAVSAEEQECPVCEATLIQVQAPATKKPAAEPAPAKPKAKAKAKGKSKK